jgi:hypothetical protein
VGALLAENLHPLASGRRCSPPEATRATWFTHTDSSLSAAVLGGLHDVPETIRLRVIDWVAEREGGRYGRAHECLPDREPGQW